MGECPERSTAENQHFSKTGEERPIAGEANNAALHLLLLSRQKVPLLNAYIRIKGFEALQEQEKSNSFGRLIYTL